VNRTLLALTLLVAAAGCSRAHPAANAPSRTARLRAEALPAPYARLVAFADTLDAPGPADWLAVHDEPGQSLAEYLATRRRTPTRERNALVLVPIGEPTPAQRRVLAATGRYLQAWTGLPVRLEPAVPLGAVPAQAKRAERGFGPQVSTQWVLDSVLVARRAPDAFLEIGLSALDLYPAGDWNFVFGQARPEAGVGVWSMARYGDAGASPAAEGMVLARTIRTASHETGHLLGLAHCTTWRCLMNGSNSLPELDRRPLELCPACLAKLCMGRGLDPVARARTVAAVLDSIGLSADARAAGATAERLQGAGH